MLSRYNINKSLLEVAPTRVTPRGVLEESLEILPSSFALSSILSYIQQIHIMGRGGATSSRGRG
jgi:hypothetical protein